jgi:hypothetical protein
MVAAHRKALTVNTPSITSKDAGDGFSSSPSRSAISELPPINKTNAVSHFLDISESQVREYHRTGVLRGFLAGRSLRLTRDAVQQFITDRENAK